MAGSIVDDPTPVEPQDAATPVNAQDLAEMLFLVFEAVKDLQYEFKQFREEMAGVKES